MTVKLRKVANSFVLTVPDATIYDLGDYDFKKISNGEFVFKKVQTHQNLWKSQITNNINFDELRAEFGDNGLSLGQENAE